MNWTCEQTEQLLTDYLDGLLPADAFLYSRRGYSEAIGNSQPMTKAQTREKNRGSALLLVLVLLAMAAILATIAARAVSTAATGPLSMSTISPRTCR